MKKLTEEHNMDNISRTNAYANYYERNREITWAYLASFVSRNAGWNMADLHSKPFKTLLSVKQRLFIFTTYERANWLIFSDAYPQLLIYEESKRRGIPLFSLLRHFHVSRWMIKEWFRFWYEKNPIRLIQAQIINEQYVIQKPVIESPFFQKGVFYSFPYILQEKLHYGAVLLPTITGRLYGRTVKKFTNVKERIKLGKELAKILLSSPERHLLKQFYNRIPHTGSRFDYEQFFPSHTFPTPIIRSVYPIVYHDDHIRVDWFNKKVRNLEKHIGKTLPDVNNYEMTKWYEKKRKQLIYASKIKKLLF